MVQNVKDVIGKSRLGVGQILSRAWSLWRDNFWTIFWITLIVYIPVNVILYFVPEPQSLGDFRVYLRVIQILEFFIGILATMAVAFFVDARIHGKSLEYKDSLKKSLSRWHLLIGTGLLQGLFLLGLFILLIVPGIIFSVYWSFTLFAVALRNEKWKSAMDYSKSLVSGRWWSVFGYLLAFGIIALFVTGIAGFLSGFFFGFVEYFVPRNIVFDVISNLVVDVASSFFTVVSVLFFLNLESTKMKKK